MAALQLTEDNARFVLLAVVLVLYMLAGAAIFQYLESDAEARMARDFWRTYSDFRNHYCKLLQAAANASYTTAGSERPPPGRGAGGGGDSAAEGRDAVDGGAAVSLATTQQSPSPAASAVPQHDPMDRVHRLLYAYGNATAAGIIHKRRRWDFAGSFHFVGTIVSTIGYGNTTPQTTAGKAVVILYGFLGCSGGILFFNLFLERIITLLACGLRAIHLRRLRNRVASGRLAQRRVSAAAMAANRRLSRASLPSQDVDLDDDIDDSILDNWKPSVYWVMLYLAGASVVVASCAAAVYSPVEDWSFFEALYFCFVSFATIGFGDYVTTQEPDYPHVHWYRFGNFVFLVLGCCCIYSLFNVTSIVIKQFLNWLIVKLACTPWCGPRAGPRRPSVISRKASRRGRRRSSSVRGRRRSSAGLPHNLRRPAPLSSVLGRGATPVCNSTAAAAGDSSEPEDSDAEAGGLAQRRLSGELISMTEFLRANKVSLAVMQKQLYETAQMSRAGYYPAHLNHHHHHGGGSGGGSGATGGGSGGSAGGGGSSSTSSGRFVPGTVGPLAILSQKLDTSGR